MKVTVLEPYGYCAGVNLAINLAIKTKQENSSNNVVVLGMLVHNSNTLETLEKHGIKTIFKKDSSLDELIDEIKEPSIVILTAHGHSKAIEEKLSKNGHKIVDATCPFVKKSMQEINNEISKENDVFYIGVKNHPEANASLSLGSKVHFIDVKNPIIPEIDNDSPTVISQTTLSASEVSLIYENISLKYKNAKFIKGICNASTLRQDAILKIDNDVDKIYVVGGLNSNNSKTLFELAKKHYPNISVELIQNADDIKEKDLLGLSHIAISSGASTPKEVIEQIKAKLLN
ncbi:MAG: 4-hydroxy-3-methylbut-2-enyl diphosphate reductase [Firmicutes bacterium]|nr:4-hydroxy-3-methylbut-2-enyl diphosphate reductase [Candidatus Fiminaster equi]